MRNNFKTKIRMLTSAAALGVVMMVGASMPASALVLNLNFIDYIDGVGGVGEKAITGSTFLGGVIAPQGLPIKAFGSNNLDPVNNSPNIAPYAYLDSKSGGLGAGIGVCQSITAGNQCKQSNDDNVTGAVNSNVEVLSLEFLQDVTISNPFFRGANHESDFVSGRLIDVGLSRDFTPSAGSTGAFGLVSAVGSQLGGTLTDFVSLFLTAGDTIDFRFNNQQFYLSGLTVTIAGNEIVPQVPLPASVYLFGTGLLGIGFLARRRRRKTKGELKFA